MADSIDRVFVHALNTVKKIPKTGAARPPPSDRMRLYGLYKQAMEGDVDGVMERPSTAGSGLGIGGSSSTRDEIAREQDKWDAWNSQKGLSRTEAKRRYVEALIETMHKYANTPNALELVAELEFVWNQVKSNSPSSSGEESSSSAHSRGGGGGDGSGIGIRRFQQAQSGADGPMKVLSPMSEEDASEQRLMEVAELEGDEIPDDYARRNDKRSKRMERAIVRLSAEIAALREQIATGREWRSRKERSLAAWLEWGMWLVTKHFVADFIVLAVILLWMRKRKDRRLEDYARGTARLIREYLRKILPSR
ncbi:acyl CoA binding protein-domain-containing protein [Lasiosphaeria miniovina]|uniref:Acyl CoA binding protein-domain-containing protein n=1 Tax=Lasiosphaeria miniovina TaxID=1954250 RepID=A0AA39ZZJ7_9PEZI|nr:acyl CoA binding protein-domain-containing protein [Lasiosphaeria miniovina]KAK0706553.1 acyl CoA binding protein-domain-containing protein [Lasiosphaeria miniovina]